MSIPYYEDELTTIYNADCREVQLSGIDAIVTDPPYELAFMGKSWDKQGVSFDPETWKVLLDAAKPGAHLLAMGIGRTHHRLMCAIEDAGWEIRTCLYWVFSTGFPKSLDVSKAINANIKTGGSSPRNLRKDRQGDDYEPTGQEDYHKGRMFSSEIANDDKKANLCSEAIRWSGWGTALKPAVEIIVMARKPLEGTVAQNVLRYGTGAINIDGGRVRTEESLKGGQYSGKERLDGNCYGKHKNLTPSDYKQPQGRFPSTLIHDGSEEVLAEFAKYGIKKGEIGRAGRKAGGNYNASSYRVGIVTETSTKDSGTAARFFKACEWAEEDIPSLFYYPKASRRERDQGLEGMPERESQVTGWSGDGMPLRQDGTERKMPLARNDHATVKPLALMRYLIKLVTPPNGVVLDPFAGSGSTLVAAKQLGFRSIGIELDEHYAEISVRRIQAQNPALL